MLRLNAMKENISRYRKSLKFDLVKFIKTTQNLAPLQYNTQLLHSKNPKNKPELMVLNNSNIDLVGDNENTKFG